MIDKSNIIKELQRLPSGPTITAAIAEIKRLCKGELMLDLTFTKRMCAALNRPLSSGFSVNDVTEYVKGLEADAKRLDWIQKHGHHLVGPAADFGVPDGDGWRVELMDSLDVIGRGPTLREAIDAAMKELDP